jgi:hypothetical protein
LSTCKKTKRSTWVGTKAERNTDAGMKMVVYHEVGKGGKKTSRTVFERA